ncbi:uncharacterized protein LOC124285855 [Haliotis rubra]|uniref:uncharacterized protein LOC124285855 n=1 Tax=Haliotis rubra TaxID=36100 RepID=UPI001EE5471A|nr:uncharacterized protein LOC124285855 [Haliotis rubra]
MDTFVSKPNANHWQNVLSIYGEVFAAKVGRMKTDKGKELQDLDQWYQAVLPTSIADRDEKHVTHDELVKLMKWKLLRGKFRPRLQQLVSSNTPDDVISTSKKAFQVLPDVSSAIKTLSLLKGVGPATASAILAAGSPEYSPFMADESMLALQTKPLTYTHNAYLVFLEQVQAICKQLKGQDKAFHWTPKKVELVLWTYHVGKVLTPDTIEKSFVSKTLKRENNNNEEHKPKKKKK